MTIFEKMAAKFRRIYERGDGQFFFAPGQLNIFGEHTAPNGGNSLLCALDLGTYGLAGKRDDGLIHLMSLNYEERGVIEADILSLYRQQEYDWAIYPLGVMDALKKNCGSLGGADIIYCGNLPQRAGLASSGSIGVLTAFIVNELFDLGLKVDSLASLCRRAEDHFVGLAANFAEPAAVALARQHQALLFNCATGEYDYCPFQLPGYSLVVGYVDRRRPTVHARESDSYKSAANPAKCRRSGRVEKSWPPSFFNRRRAECQAALASLQTRMSLDSLCHLTLPQFNSVASVLTDEIQLKRARHVITENQRAVDGAEAARAGEAERLGQLLTESHISLRDDFESGSPEMNMLVELALKEPGVLGAKMSGGNTGGSAICLVANDSLERFEAGVAQAFEKNTGFAPFFHRAVPSDGVRRGERL